jgi:hypothetical protein
MKLPQYVIRVIDHGKTIALVLFITMPFISFYVGMRYQKDITVPQFSITYALENPTPTVSSTILPSTTQKPTSTPVIQGSVIIFEGILEAYDDSCIVDAQCKATVNGYTIITNPGMVVSRDPIGKSDVSRDDVGKKVKVRARIVSGKNLTLVGDEGHYVLKG